MTAWAGLTVFTVVLMLLIVYFRRVELRKVMEIFTRMFHDPASKVSCSNFVMSFDLFFGQHFQIPVQFPPFKMIN